MQRYLLNTVADLAKTKAAATNEKASATPPGKAAAAGKSLAKPAAKPAPRPLRPGSKFTPPPPPPRKPQIAAPAPPAKPQAAQPAAPVSAVRQSGPGGGTLFFGQARAPVTQTPEAKAIAAKASAAAPDAGAGQNFSTKAADLQRLSMQVLAQSGLPAPPNRVKGAVTRAAGAYDTHEDLLDMLANVRPIDELEPFQESPPPAPAANVKPTSNASGAAAKKAPARPQTYAIPNKAPKPMRAPVSMKPLAPAARRPLS